MTVDFLVDQHAEWTWYVSRKWPIVYIDILYPKRIDD